MPKRYSPLSIKIFYLLENIEMFAAYVIDGGGSNNGCFTISTPTL